jgi:NitT/TauT family transport system substrate-binding protein
VDVATGAGFVLVSNSFSHPTLRTLGTIACSESNELVARKDRGIGSPGDLKGKRIGVTRKSTGEFYLGRFLLFNLLAMKDVEIVDLTPGRIVREMKDGTIDAGFTWDPNVYNIKKELGENVVSWPGQSGQAFYFILITYEHWLRRRPSAAEKLLRALVQAEDSVRHNEAASKEFVREKFGYESDYIDYAWERHDFVVELPQALILALEDQARWRIQNKLTDETAIPNYLECMYLDAMLKVKPDAVTIIR